MKSNACSPSLLVLGFYNNGIGIGLEDVVGLDIFFPLLAPPYTGYRRCQTSSNLSIEPLILNLPPRLYQNQFQLLDFTSSIEVHIWGNIWSTGCPKKYHSGISGEKNSIMFYDHFRPVGPLIWTTFHHLGQLRTFFVQPFKVVLKYVLYGFVLKKFQKGNFSEHPANDNSKKRPHDMRLTFGFCEAWSLNTKHKIDIKHFVTKIQNTQTMWVLVPGGGGGAEVLSWFFSLSLFKVFFFSCGDFRDPVSACIWLALWWLATCDRRNPGASPLSRDPH